MNIPDFDRPLQLAGGDNNAYTTQDYTNYYMTIPAENVETGFWLESDRMLSLAFTPESLEVQRKVVMEEFMQNYINQPYGDLSHLMAGLAFREHSYRWPTIGLKLEHIAEAEMDDVKKFFFNYYCPSNAILSVVGNISFDRTVELAMKWFGGIPSGGGVRNVIKPEPAQKRGRRLVVERNVPRDLLSMGFHICRRTDADFYACDMISDVLSNGRSCRLHQRLVERDHVFTNIDAYISANIDGGMLYITGMPADNVSLEEAEEAVWKEIHLLKIKDVKKAELDKAKNKYEMNAAMELASYQRKAALLAYYEMLDNVELINQDVDNYRSINYIQFANACRKYLERRNSAIIYYKKQS